MKNIISWFLFLIASALITVAAKLGDAETVGEQYKIIKETVKRIESQP